MQPVGYIVLYVPSSKLASFFGKYNLNHIWDRVLFNQFTLHNNGQAQTNTAHNQLLVIIGHSGHALNSECVLRESQQHK